MNLKTMLYSAFTAGVILGTPVALANKTGDEFQKEVIEEVKAQYCDGMFSGLSPEFIASVVLDSPKRLFYHMTNFDALELARPDSALLGLLDRTLERIGPYREFIESASRNTGIPENYLIARIAVESAGNRRAVSRARAFGLGQIKTDSYWTVNRTVMSDIDKLKKILPEGKLERLAEKPLNEQLLLSLDSLGADPAMLDSYLKGYHLSENDFLHFRLPLALNVIKYYGGRLPKKGRLVNTLFDPELNIHNTALMSKHDLLFLYAKNMALQDSVYGEASMERSLIPPQAEAVAYNGGFNYASKLLGLLVEQVEKDVPDSSSIEMLLTPPEIARRFSKLITKPESRSYWRKTMELTKYLDDNPSSNILR